MSNKYGGASNAVSEVGRDLDGRNISQISGRPMSEGEEKGPETFLEQVQRKTMQIIESERLDSLGYEDENNTVLEL